MRITIAAVGRIRAGPERDLQNHYAGRLRWKLEIREVEERKKLPTAKLVRREAELLSAACPADAVRIALDGTGRQLASTELARRLGDWQDGGTGNLAFLIGGADGLDGSILKQADLLLSLGAMTWPHFLVRGMLLEQLYRAQQILANHPYHRE